MARFSEQWLAKLLEKSEIVEVLSEYMSLEQRGTRLWAKCPWHSERNASFCVSPDRQMYYCFSCKKGGGVINFIMENEKFSYMEAVSMLAERANMELPAADADDSGYQKKKEYRKRLYAMMRELAIYYHRNLYTAEGQGALQYLEQRGIAGQIKPYGLGFAKNKYDDAHQFLSTKGYTLQEMLDAGVVRHKDGRVYDFFRNRAMFPIQNVYGDVIGFGGRVMDDSEPKYLNSGETLIFNKRYNLYALNLVRKKRSIQNIILTEGYMDTVALAGAGIENAVASLGTAFTPGQARLLRKYTQKVFLCYDGDEAGVKAALRAVDILAAEKLQVGVILLPDGLDPDDYINRYGVEAFRKLGKEAYSITAFKLHIMARDYDFTVPDEVVAYATKAVELIASLENELEKERFVRQLMEQTGLSQNSLQRQMEKFSGQVKGNTLVINEANLQEKEIEDEGRLLATLLERPDLIEDLRISKKLFTSEVYKNVLSYMESEIKKGIMPTGAEIISVFPNESEKIAALLMETVPEGTSHGDYAEVLIGKIETTGLRKQRDALLTKLHELDEAAKEEAMRKIAEINLDLHKMNKNF